MKVQNIYTIPLLLSALLMTACYQDELDASDTDAVILEGYLYQRKSIDSVKLSQLVSFDTQDSSFSIEDAEVTVSWAGNDFPLEHLAEKPGYYAFLGEGFSVVLGDTYEISLAYFGKLISATTTVPTEVAGLQISVDTIEIEPVEEGDFQGLFNRAELDNIEVAWENADASYYYVLVENIEEDPEIINDIEFGDFEGNFNFITEPTNSTTYSVQPFSLAQYGTYQVVVYHVAQEYVDLYETTDEEQDSRNFTEPLNNVNNGLGIFTSFSTDTLYFEVVKPEE